MTRVRLARLIWKLWKRRNYYKYWYEYELSERKVWLGHIDDLNEQIKDYKEGNHGSVQKYIYLNSWCSWSCSFPLPQ